MFEAHGEFEVTQSGNNLEIVISGAFNNDGAQAYVDAIKNAASKFNGAPFKVLIDAEQYEGATPDSYETANELDVWLQNNNMLAKAIVSKSTLKFETALKFEPDLMAKNVAHFTTIKQAREWLNRFK